MPEVLEKHTPVLYGELIESLHFFEPGNNIIVDATLGLGGHACGVIQKLGAGDVFIGLDCDETNLVSAKEKIEQLIKDIPSNKRPTLFFVHANFSTLASTLNSLAIPHITALYADLGVSSVHFDTAERGFSFRFDGPLDMRLDVTQGVTAATLVNTLSYEKLAEIFRAYGDESRAGFIAKKIIEARTICPFETTKQLADVVIKAWRDSLPRIFQALRIAVNDEYGSLRTLLDAAHDALVSRGSLSIIAFHSGEDRIVKHFFREKSQATKDSLTGQDLLPGTLEIITKKPIMPTDNEVALNPRSRSALLRIAYKQ